MGRPATLLRPGLIGMSQPKLRPTTHPINAPFGKRVDRRCKLAVRRDVLVGLPAASSGSVGRRSIRTKRRQVVVAALAKCGF